MRRHRKHQRVLTGLLLLVVGQVARGGTVSYLADNNGTPDSVFSIIGAAATGQTMNGLMTVQVFFTDGTTVTSTTSTWSSGCGAGCGSVSGSLAGGTWTLTETGDTGALAPTPAWTLTNTSQSVGILEVILTGTGLGFDRNAATCGPSGCPSASFDYGTPGSGYGITYAEASGAVETGRSAPYTVSVQYSNIITLTTPTPCIGTSFPGNAGTGCGDMWQQVSMTFATDFSGSFRAGGPTQAEWQFVQDTDLIGVPTTPEPASLYLAGFALAALLLRYSVTQRRRRFDRTNPEARNCLSCSRLGSSLYWSNDR